MKVCLALWAALWASVLAPGCGDDRGAAMGPPHLFADSGADADGGEQ